MRPQSGLSFVRRIIIFSVVVISLILGLAAHARPVVNAVVLPPNENRNGEIMLSLDSDAYTDAMRIYLRYPTQIYYGTEYVTFEIVMAGIVGNVAYVLPAVQYMTIDETLYGTDSLSDIENWLTYDAEFADPTPSSFGYYNYSSSTFIHVPIDDFTSGSVEFDITSIVVPYTIWTFDGYLVEGWVLGDGPLVVDWDETITISGVAVMSDYDRGYMDGRAAAWDELRDIVYNDGYKDGYAFGKYDGIKIGQAANPIYQFYDDVVLPSGVKDEIVKVDGKNQLHDNVSSIIAADYIMDIDFEDADKIRVILRMPNDFKINTKPATKKYDTNYYYNAQKAVVYLPKPTQFDTEEKVTAEMQKTIVYYELADSHKTIYYMTDYDEAKAIGYNDGYNDGVRDASAVTKEGAFDWVGKLLSNVAGKFLAIELWPGVSIGLLVGIPFAITLVAFVVGLLQGRSKND
jgi:hypothetical protein